MDQDKPTVQTTASAPEPNPAPQYDWQRSDYRSFELGDVFSRAFGAVKDRFAALFAIAFFLVFLPNFIVGVVPYRSYLGREQLTVDPENFLQMTLLSLGLGLIPLLVGAIIAPAACIYLLLKSFRGERVPVLASVRIGLSRFFPLLIAAIISALGMGLGFLFLIIPGLILYCGWFVITPAIVMEKQSGTDALSRSWALTQGHKWMVFVVIIAYLVLTMVLTTIATLPFGEIIRFDFETGTLVSAGAVAIMGSVVASALAAAISTMFGSALIASTYQELRVVKEGVDAETIADIFS